jgi:hypothetical protein
MVHNFCPTTPRKWAGYYWHKQPHENQDDPNWNLFLGHETTLCLAFFISQKPDFLWRVRVWVMAKRSKLMLISVVLSVVLVGCSNGVDTTVETIPSENTWAQELICDPPEFLDCFGVDLTFVNLNRANLIGAYMTGANLYKAKLERANLSGAELGGANLTDANLRYANLANANLTSAVLTGADLTGADLTGADLTNANLRAAIMPDGTIHD